MACGCVLHAGQWLLCGLLFGVHTDCMFVMICMLVSWLLCILNVCCESCICWLCVWCVACGWMCIGLCLLYVFQLSGAYL